MKDEHKTKEQLINELVEMRQRIAEWEASETERKWAEVALREREAQLQAVFEAAGNISFVTMDLTGTEPLILDFSPGAERIFGYSREEVIGKPVAMLHLPEDMARFPQVLEAMRQRKSGFTGESTLVRKSGEEFPTLFTTYPIFDAEGNMPATLSVSVDITERKRTEEALQESEERLRSLFETMAEGVVWIAPDGQIVQANHTAEHILGLKRSEIEGRNYVGPEWEILRPDGTPMPPEEMAGPRAMNEKRPVKDVVMGAKRPDGSISWINVSATPLINEAGSFEGVVGTFADITERKRAEEVLQRRAAQLELLNDMGSRIAAILELDSVLDQAGGPVQERFGYHHVGLFTLDRERGELVMRARAGAFTDLFPPEHRLKLGQGMVGWVGRHGESLLANDVHAEPRYVNLYPDQLPTQSELSVPIRVGKEIVGVLDVQSPQLNAFDENDVMVMETLADQIAVAIENARLYEAVQQELTERKRAEEALAEERNLLRTLIDNLPDYIYVKDTESRYLVSSMAHVRFLGATTPDEVVGKSVFELFPQELAAQYYADDQVVIRSGQPLLKREERSVDQAGNSLWLLTTKVPLRDSDGKVVGLVGIARDITERKRVEETLRQRNRELALLNRAGQAFSSTLDLDQVLVTVLEEVRRLLDVVACSAWLIDPETNELVCRQAVGPQSEIVRGWRLAPGEGIAGWVALSGESLITPDIRADERHFKDVDRQTGLPLRSILSVPLRVKEDVIGVLQVVSTEVGRFSPADLTLLESLAASAASAIENARLFQESQRRTEEMAALRQVNLATLSTLERDQVFEIMLDQLGTVIDYDTAAIKVITPNGKDKMVAGRGPVIYDQVMWDGFDVKDNKLVQEMKETRRPVVVHDTHTDERYEQVGNWERFGSWLGAPLFVKDDLIGYLAVEKTFPGFYDENAIQLLGDFAHAAAIALENARLYEQVRRDAETRSVLLREVNHRVQNNLTAIIGFLYAARRRAGMEDQAVYQSIMQDLVSRVQGLSTVHSLFSASGWAPLRLSELAAQVVQSSLQMLSRDKRVSVEVSPSPVRVTPDQAHNLALVINELTTNTVKHTLWERNTGHLTVGIALEDDTVLFEFRDDGPGYPEEVLQLERHTVGLDLIQNIVRKGLRGELSLHNDHGAVAVIQFRAKA